MSSRRCFLGFGGYSILLSVTGCVGIPTREETLSNDSKKFSDQELLSSIYPKFIKHDGYEIRYIGSNLIEIKKEISVSRAFSSDKSIVEYQSVDYSTDQLAKNYVQAAQKRGNVVRLYKSVVNSKIASIFELPRDSFTPKTGLDQALIEFSSNGRMVSILYRVVFVWNNEMARYSNQYSRFVVGSDVRKVENQMSASFLKDYEISSSL